MSKDTISRWLKRVMFEAGIDTNVFKPRSKRAALLLSETMFLLMKSSNQLVGPIVVLLKLSMTKLFCLVLNSFLFSLCLPLVMCL